VAEKDLTIDFDKMEVVHFDTWDTTVYRYLQAVRSSSCKGGCGDVYFTKLLQEKDEVSMHHLYGIVRVELMQQDGALQKKDKLELAQVRSVSRTELSLTGDAPHWILQDTKRKCYHFYQLHVFKMHNIDFLIWFRMTSGQLKLTPCGTPHAKKKGKHSSTQLQNVATFNFQQGERPLCVPLCIASALKHGKDHVALCTLLQLTKS
jgi:hypothetical protein